MQCEHLESIFCLLSLHVLYQTQLTSVHCLSLGLLFYWLFSAQRCCLMPKVLVKNMQFEPNYALGDLLTLREQLPCKEWCLGGWGYFTALYLPQTALQYKQFSQNPWGMRLLSKSNIKTDIICSPSPISSNPYFFKLCLWWHFRNDVFIGERSIFRFFPLCFWNNSSGIRGRQSGRESAGPKIAALTHTRLSHLPMFCMVFSSSLSARPYQCSALS